MARAAQLPWGQCGAPGDTAVTLWRGSQGEATQALSSTQAGGGEGTQQVNYSALCDPKHGAQDYKWKPSDSQ